MALAAKTVEYSFFTNLAESTATQSFGPITITIPETVSRTFVTADIAVFARDSYASSSNRNSISGSTTTVGIEANAGNSINNTLSWPDTSEHIAFEWHSNHVDYFNTYFTGSEMLVSASLSHTSFIPYPLTNTSCTLTLTYLYDDSAITRVKTVQIPYNSITAKITTASYCPIGIIEPLDNILPEASKSYKDIWIRFSSLDGNCGDTTSSFAFSCSLNELPSTCSAIWNCGRAGGTWWDYVWKCPDIPTNVSLSLSASFWGKHIDALPLAMIRPTLYATYTYDHTASSRIYNNCIIPYPNQCVPLRNSIRPAVYQWFDVDFYLPENNITNAYSSWIFLFSGNGNVPNIFLSELSSSFVSYDSHNGGTLMGMYAINYTSSLRFDHGYNTASLCFYTNTAGTGQYGVSGYLLLGYTSDKHSAGDNVHSHTIYWDRHDRLIGTTQVTSSGVYDFTIPEDNWWLQGYIAKLTCVQSAGTFSALNFVTSGSNKWNVNDLIYRNLGYFRMATDSDLALTYVYFDAKSHFKQWPTEPNTSLYKKATPKQRYSFGLEPGSSETWRMFFGGYCSYHSITSSISGSVSGYTNDGSNITVDLWQSGSGLYLGRVYTVAGGTFNYTWYDDTIPIIAVATSGSTGGASLYATASIV
jgi:hypothetical protein